MASGEEGGTGGAPAPGGDDLDALRALAGRAADAAADVIAAALAADDWAVRVKADDTPVTDVDVAAERAIRAVLAAATPAASFFGEETGDGAIDAAGTDGAVDGGVRAAADAARSASPALRWLVDPIDGTKSFVRRLPFYSTQIALAIDGELVVGVSNAPGFGAAGERLSGVRGGQALLDGRPVRSSGVTTIEETFLSSGNLGTLARDAARWRRYGELVARVRRVRGYGDFCHYHQLASGGCDLVVESDVNILDVAALTVAVRAAGGVVTDLDGRPIDESTRSVLAAATPALHAAALALLDPR